MPANAEYDVAVVGGGPAGCSAGIFTARAGLATVVFDRGRSSIKRCAHLENYLGFPDGIDAETLYGLMHDHAERAGCTIEPERVESIDRTEDDAGFRLRLQDADSIAARYVVAATRYDGEYMRGLDADAAMFETYEHDGEVHERFDREYADRDGRTPVEDLYIASPSAAADTQAIVAAGRGARVARTVIADARRHEGWWDEVAEGVDWMRRRAAFDEAWRDRDTWVEWFDDRYAEDAPMAADDERFAAIRDAYIDDRLSTYLSDAEIDRRRAAAHEALAAHVSVESAVAELGAEPLLEAIDDEAIRAYASETGLGAR
jgi:hypothetical protein